MHQKNKILAGLAIAAVVFSGLAIGLIYNFMNPQRTTIYLFNDNYEMGTQVTKDMLTSVQIDSTIVEGGRKDNVSTRLVTDSEYAEILKTGESLRIDVSSGMPLTTSMLSVTGGTAIENNMTTDSIAVTIKVDEYSGISNDLRRGSRVNIYCSINNETKLLQQNKRILEVFTDGSVITGVSVEEDAAGSIELIYAEEYGSIYLGLVDSTGYQSVESDTTLDTGMTGTASTDIIDPDVDNDLPAGALDFEGNPASSQEDVQNILSNVDNTEESSVTSTIQTENETDQEAE